MYEVRTTRAPYPHDLDQRVLLTTKLLESDHWLCPSLGPSSTVSIVSLHIVHVPARAAVADPSEDRIRGRDIRAA